MYSLKFCISLVMLLFLSQNLYSKDAEFKEGATFCIKCSETKGTCIHLSDTHLSGIYDSAVCRYCNEAMERIELIGDKADSDIFRERGFFFEVISGKYEENSDFVVEVYDTNQIAIGHLIRSVEKDQIQLSYDPVSITESTSEVESDIKIFPNPTSEYFTVYLESSTIIESVRIFDNSGNLVLENEVMLTGYADINVQKLSSGKYFVQIKTDHGYNSAELVISK